MYNYKIELNKKYLYLSLKLKVHIHKYYNLISSLATWDWNIKRVYRIVNFIIKHEIHAEKEKSFKIKTFNELKKYRIKSILCFFMNNAQVDV